MNERVQTRTQEDVNGGPVRPRRALLYYVCAICPLVGSEGYRVNGPRCTPVGVDICGNILGRRTFIREGSGGWNKRVKLKK